MVISLENITKINKLSLAFYFNVSTRAKPHSYDAALHYKHMSGPHGAHFSLVKHRSETHNENNAMKQSKVLNGNLKSENNKPNTRPQ